VADELLDPAGGAAAVFVDPAVDPAGVAEVSFSLVIFFWASTATGIARTVAVAHCSPPRESTTSMTGLVPAGGLPAVAPGSPAVLKKTYRQADSNRAIVVAGRTTIVTSFLDMTILISNIRDKRVRRFRTLEHLAIILGCSGAERAKNYLIDTASSIKMTLDRMNGERTRPFRRKAVNSGADGWKCHGLNAVLFGQRQTVSVAVGQQIGLVGRASRPYGSDCMDHPFCRQIETFRYLGRACGAAAQDSTLGLQFGSRRPVDGPVDTAATQKRGVGRVNDGIDFESRYIAFNYDHSLHDAISIANQPGT
jgi:hypothetical protein